MQLAMVWSPTLVDLPTEQHRMSLLITSFDSAPPVPLEMLNQEPADHRVDIWIVHWSLRGAPVPLLEPEHLGRRPRLHPVHEAVRHRAVRGAEFGESPRAPRQPEHLPGPAQQDMNPAHGPPRSTRDTIGRRRLRSQNRLRQIRRRRRRGQRSNRAGPCRWRGQMQKSGESRRRASCSCSRPRWTCCRRGRPPQR